MSKIALKDDINGLFKDVCIKIYDPENKKLIGIFDNFAKAGNKLGLSISSIQGKCSTKNRVFSPTLKKEVACRTSRITPGDLKLINKTKTNWL